MVAAVPLAILAYAIMSESEVVARKRVRRNVEPSSFKEMRKIDVGQQSE